MKTLILMRHAKSSWKHPELADTQRPLNKRGEKDAPFMGKQMRDAGLEPQAIYSSTAERCAKTAELVADKLGYTGEIHYMDALYLAEPNTYIELLRGLPDDVDRVLIVGHNPGLEGLLQILTQKVESLATGTMAVVNVPIRAWELLDVRIDCKLVQLVRPK